MMLLKGDFAQRFADTRRCDRRE